ncbi:hypothetical protein [Rugamonas apoptosis]|uniref:Uncharacterized protein n=1 Tax=Rugamonas apoptosis TaxID=2758570 RepID=A0A7W2F9F0_9BURK|nr:hypothetical protein [Rugamonas apoptosis]MBA5687583.1 hypothetical protein [Rugamonas apoptosis]
MNDGIYEIRAEIRIAAANEDAARKLIASQKIPKTMSFWRKDPLGPGGHLYIGGELFFDADRNNLTFLKPRSQ